MDSNTKFVLWFAVAAVVFVVVGKILHDNAVQHQLKKREEREEIETSKKLRARNDSLIQAYKKRIEQSRKDKKRIEQSRKDKKRIEQAPPKHLQEARKKPLQQGGALCWYDPKFDVIVSIKKVGGRYHLRDFLGESVLETWHSSRPRYGRKSLVRSGRIFVTADRIGEPNIYYVLTATGSLDVYLNCEFGHCSYDRTMRQTAKPIYEAP